MSQMRMLATNPGRRLSTYGYFVRQVQAEYLETATPEANQKFNQMLHGLASGKLTVNDLRAEARSAADQLRAFKRELGEEAGDGLDHYLDILDRFLRETESSAGVAAEPASSPTRPTTAPAPDRK